MEPDMHEVQVDTQSLYLPEQSSPEEKRFVFAYTVTIRNTGAVAAKLLTRHWHITDANGKVENVHGTGVIGEQPYLRPGESFQYTSGTVIETPVGAMQGSYDLLDENGATFKADIAPFSLHVPGSLH